MINQKLIRAREAKYLTQEELAKAIGVEPFTVSRWENGRQQPRSFMINQLSKALEKPPEELGYSRASLDIAEALLYDVSDMQNEDIMQLRDWTTWFGFKQAQICTMITLLRGRAFSCEEVQLMISQEIKAMDDELRLYQVDERESISRRQVLIAIAALPAALLAYSATDSVMEDFLPQCVSSITACWHLMTGKAFISVNEVLSKLVPTLGTLALRPSKYQQLAAQLATQAAIIQAILSMHQLNFNAREVYCNNAIRYARLSGDNKLQAVAFMYLGYTFSFCYQPRQPKKAIRVFQQGLLSLRNDESLIRSDILMGIAESYAQCGQEQEALRYIGLAQDYFPDYPENDSSYLYAECGITTLHQWEGKMYLELVDHHAKCNYQQKASNTLLQSVNATSLNDRCTNETVIYQAEAARGLGELDMYVCSLRQAAQMAKDLGSKKRYSEALRVFQRTPSVWTKERQVQLLAKDIFKQSVPGKAQ